MSIHTLYLTVARGRYGYGTKITKTSKKKPKAIPVNCGVVKLEIHIPDNVLRPPQCRVEVKPEHLGYQPIEATVSQP